MPETDPWMDNINAVQQLVGSEINKVDQSAEQDVGEPEDALALSMDDDELLRLAKEWEQNHKTYYPKIETRSKRNETYLLGEEYKEGTEKRVSSNLIFEAQQTFKSQALAKNPEPVVWSDNTTEGQTASNQIKAMLQYKADTMVLRKKLGVALDQWSINFIGIIKHGWDKKAKDFKSETRNPKNFVWCDPNAYIDETGRYRGVALGERVTTTAKKLAEEYPSAKSDIELKVDGKMGTKVTYTEFWTDEFCFCKFEQIILDKYKNPYYNYPEVEKNTEEEQTEYGLEAETVTPGKNHFSIPLMPYSFFTVFSLQQQPHDITNLIEQAIPQQDRIIARDLQITKNLKNGNNSIAVSGVSFNVETARQAATALEDGDPVLVPDGQVENGIRRLPASPLPDGILEAQEVDKQMLRQLFGTYGITPQKPSAETTARGQILNQDQDSSRIGGGVGEALEQLADNVFNWWLQLMYKFYDEPHYAAIMGSQSTVQYVQVINSDINRQFVVSVSPNSMSPKDELSEQNLALSLAQQKLLDPLTLMKFMPNIFPDPNASAQQLMMYLTNPQLYAQQLGVPAQQAPQQGTGQPIQQEGTPNPNLGQEPNNSPLSQVPLK